jgi:uncharacterized membrane protein
VFYAFYLKYLTLEGIIPVTVIGLLAVLGLDISEFNSTESFYNNMIVVSKFSSAFQHFYYPNYISCYVKS